MDKQDIIRTFSDNNSSNLIMRIQLILEKPSEEDDCDEEDYLCPKSLEKTIPNEIILTGIKNIKGVSCIQSTTTMNMMM